MTAAMRAVPSPKGPKVLRIGVVQRGRILEERILAMGAMAPFERVGPHYYLNLAEVVDARMALATGIHDLEALRSMARHAGDALRLRLPDDARGRIVLDGTTLLFQFVVRPPLQPRPQLPLAVKGGFFRQIDWDLTILAAFSFLVHFGLVGALCSDWMDPVVDESVTVRLVDPSPMLPHPATETPTESTPPETSTSASREAPAPKGRDAHAGPRAATPRGDDGAAIAEQATAMQMGILGALGSGPAVQGALDRDTVPVADLSQAATSPMAVTGGEPRFATNPIVRPGSPRRGLASVGNYGIDDHHGPGRESSTKGPSMGETQIEPPRTSVPIADAERVVMTLRPKFRICYQRGLNTDPEMAGSVTLVAKVAPNGEVSEVDPSRAIGLSADVITCIERVVRNAQFSAPGSSGGSIQIPVKFLRQAR